MVGAALGGTLEHVMTVTGEIPPEQLGITYAHEHLIVNPKPEDYRYNCYNLTNVEQAIADVKDVINAGGRTLVDMAPLNFGRDVRLLREISKRVGMHLICCSGFHKEAFIPEQARRMTITEITDWLLREIREGADCSSEIRTSIRPGVLKFGTSLNQITPMEELCMRAVIDVHLETGLPVSTHCDQGTMASQQLDEAMRYGMRAERLLLGHVDMGCGSEELLELCERGVNISIDHIGRSIDDRMRLDLLEYLFDHGCSHKIFVSSDMGKQDYLKSYGGTPGLDYLLTGFKQQFVKRFGEELFQQIVISNPADFFTIKNVPRL